MQQEINIVLSPEEYAKVFGIKINEVFRIIYKGDLVHHREEEGIRIPVTYIWENPD